MAAVLAENFDDVSSNGNFGVDLRDVSREREGENLVWSDDNSLLEAKLKQKGTNKKPGQCGKLVLDTEKQRLDFERSACTEEELLPLCMAQKSTAKKKLQVRRKKKGKKKEELRWRQRRTKKRTGLTGRARRRGRQVEECPVTPVDQCAAVIPAVGVVTAAFPQLFLPSSAPPPPPPPAAPPAPPAPPTPLEELNPINDFQQFMSQFEKVYEPQELLNRQEIFAQNMALINVTILLRPA